MDKYTIFISSDTLDLEQTLFCGQCFRWKKTGCNSYEGFSGGRFAKATQETGGIKLVCSREKDIPYWENYFDTSTDYAALCERFSEDETLKKAVSAAKGIHILRQEPFETIISFIISQNNNIPRISGIISRLCECFGEETDGGYAFPTSKVLARLEESDLAPLRAGFRNRYILDAAKKTAGKEVDLERLKSLDNDSARAELMTIVGVGRKVADCSLLFGFNRLDVCPVDVWIKRVLEKYYPDGLPECAKGYEGLAQQFLFQYERKLSAGD